MRYSLRNLTFDGDKLNALASFAKVFQSPKARVRTIRIWLDCGRAI